MAYRETTQRESAIAEGRRRSESTSACLDQFGRRPGWKSSSEAGCRPTVLLKALNASSEEVAAWMPDHWPLRPDAQAVVCPERCPTRSSRRGVSNPRELHRRHRFDPMVPQCTQAWRLSQRSCLLQAAPDLRASAPARNGRRQLGCTAHSEGIPWAPWAVVSAAAVSYFPIVGGGGAGRAAGAARESEIRRF